MNKRVEAAIDVSVKAEVTTFFDEPTNTLSYVVKDPASNACAVVDSVLDLDYPSGSVEFTSANQIIDFIREQKLELQWILETHVHADHLSAAPYIQNHLGGKIAIGANISVVQETFGKVFNAGPGFARDGSQFDTLLSDGDTLTGEVGQPILGQQAKVDALAEITARLGISPSDVIAVGDGANDLGMLTRAGTGVALHAKPAVAAQCDIRINHGDLTALLYLQGYAAQDFVQP